MSRQGSGPSLILVVSSTNDYYWEADLAPSFFRNEAVRMRLDAPLPDNEERYPKIDYVLETNDSAGFFLNAEPDIALRER